LFSRAFDKEKKRDFDILRKAELFNRYTMDLRENDFY